MERIMALVIGFSLTAALLGGLMLAFGTAQHAGEMVRASAGFQAAMPAKKVHGVN